MESTPVAAQPAVNPMRAVFSIRDFMLLWTGQAASMLGDQFHAIAASWLMLKLTGDPLALGMVMAVAGIPRAVFVVIGGAITDRVSPRRVMLAADYIRLVLSALLAVQVFTATLQPWMIYVYALVGGVVGGVFGPASMSMVPHILPEKNLQAGNSLTQGSAQLIGFIGPAAAGAMIAAFKDPSIGIGLAIAFDALTFVVSVITLTLMRAGGTATAPAGEMRAADVLQSVREGIRFMVKDPVLRLMFFIIAIANLSFGGPIMVGIPYLADTRFPEGAAAYGLILSGYSGGNLLGLILAGALPKFSKAVLRGILLVMFVVFGLGLSALAWISSTWLATFDMFLLGLLNGYISILLITGLQRSTPKEMLGRMMSMVLLANFLFMPLSQAMAGAVLRWSVVALFAGASSLMFVLFAYLAVTNGGNMLSEQLVEDKSSSPDPALQAPV